MSTTVDESTVAQQEQELNQQRPRGKQLALIFASLMLVMLMAALDQTIISTALPTIVGELHGIALQAWMITGYMLGMTISMPIYGRFGDLLGRKNLFVLAIGIFVAGSVLCGAAANMTMLIFCRGMQGIGGGGLMILSQAIVADIVPPRDRGKYSGAFGAVFGLASIGGPLIGGYLTDHASWRWCFWVNVPVGLLALLVTVVTLKLPKKAKVKATPDYAGILLLGIATTCLILGTSWGGKQYPWDSPTIIGLGAGFVLASLAFVFVERRAAEPVVPPRLFKNRAFGLSTVVSVIIGFAMLGSSVFLPTFLQMVSGSNATNSGLLMLPMMGGVLLTSVYSGRRISATGKYKRYLLIGSALSFVALLLLSTMDASTPAWQSGCYIFLLGAGIGLMIQVLVLIALNAVSPADIGTATSSTNFFREVGSSLGTAVFGAIFISRLTGRLAGDGSHPGVKVPGGSGDSITPQLVRSLPPGLHDFFVKAYADALAPSFLYIAPLFLFTLVICMFIPETPLASAASSAAPAEDAAEKPVVPPPSAAETTSPNGFAAFTANGFAAGQQHQARPPRSPVPTVRGRVLDRRGYIAENTTVALMDVRGQRLCQSNTDENGEFVLATRLPGKYTLLLDADSASPTTIAVTADIRSPLLELAIRDEPARAGSAVGMLTVAGTGAAVPAAAVSLLTERGDQVASGSTDETGGFGFAGLAAGTYTLVANPAGHEPARTRFSSDGVTSLRVDLSVTPAVAPVPAAPPAQGVPAGAPLSGQVPISPAGAEVRLLDAAGAVVATATADMVGRYRFDGVPPGSYTVVTSLSKQVRVTAQEPQPVSY